MRSRLTVSKITPQVKHRTAPMAKAAARTADGSFVTSPVSKNSMMTGTPTNKLVRIIAMAQNVKNLKGF